MAQITLNTKLTSEAFTLNDEDIINVSVLYVDGVASGSKLTIIDTANVIDQTIEVEESVSAVAALTTKLFQVTLVSRETPYLNISRVKDIVTNSDGYADIRYDSNGNVFQTIKTSMTLATVLSAINTVSKPNTKYIALVNQSGTNAPSEVDIEDNSISPLVDTIEGTWSYDSTGNFLYTKTGICSDLSKLDVQITFSAREMGADAYVKWSKNDANSILFQSGTLSQFASPAIATDTNGIIYHVRLDITLYS